MDTAEAQVSEVSEAQEKPAGLILIDAGGDVCAIDGTGC
ncbi:hypothetical protein HNP84_006688 [Thermocatellispora tengchongensis]|uniref:Uncharacterized protein n=1 Tax=Thermocatellispora tengchongensis TaxID=1073253 RepID=A0A840PDX3_9ACTN|nr:hypothetical protein [Thermocatellispora tengchongensis]